LPFKGKRKLDNTTKGRGREESKERNSGKKKKNNVGKKNSPQTVGKLIVLKNGRYRWAARTEGEGEGGGIKGQKKMCSSCIEDPRKGVFRGEVGPPFESGGGQKGKHFRGKEVSPFLPGGEKKKTLRLCRT